MRRVKTYVAAGMLLLAGTIVAAQDKISTAEEFDKTMKAVKIDSGKGPIGEVVARALAALATLRERAS